MVRAASAQTFTNGSFETGDFTGWQVSGSPVVLGALPTPVDGSYQALINSTGTTGSDIYANSNAVSAAQLDTFLNTTLPANANGNPINGEAIQQTFSTTFGATITFSYAYESREAPYNGFDETGYVLNGVFHILADTNTPGQSMANATGFFVWGLPYQTVTITVGPGTNTLGFVTYNTFNTNAPSGLFIDNVVVTPLVPVTYTTVDPPGTTTGSRILGISGSNEVGYFSDNLGRHGFFYNGTNYATLDQGTNGTLASAVSGNNVVGWYNDSGGLQHGFFYDGTSYTALVPSANSAAVTFPTGVSGSEAAGWYAVGSGAAHGFTYTGGTYAIVDPPGTTTTVINGISGNTVAGWYKDNVTGAEHGFIYDGTTYKPFDPNGSTQTQATGISGNNVVGWFVDIHGQHGFFYDGTNSKTLDPPGSIVTEALAVSGTNVVGFYNDSGGTQHGFFYDGSVFTTLDPPGSTQTQVTGISGTNAVGFYSDSQGVQHGFTAVVGVGNPDAALTLDNLFATYDGTAKSVTVTTNPANLNVTVTYNGSLTAPTAVGSYPVVATVNDPNYQGQATGTLVIGKATATVTLDPLSLSATYDGTPKSATAMTNPATQSVSFTYNGSSTPPTNAGSYDVVATINDPTYQGTGFGTLVIGQATGTVTLDPSSLTAAYDGTAKSATATTNPPGLAVTFTYNGISSPPSAVGSYTVVGTISDVNYQGTSSPGTLVISQYLAYPDWGNTYSFTGGRTETPEHDGVPNLMKYLYNINPTRPMNAADRAALPVLGTTTYQGAQYLTLTYRQYKFQTGIGINVQTSTNLQTWTTVSAADNPSDFFSQQIGSDSVTGDPIMEVGVKVNGSNRQFIRLNVTSP